MAAKGVDVAGYLWMKEKGLPKDDIKKILLIRVDDIGDVILATPVIQNLQEYFPLAAIDLLLKSSTKPIVLNHPCVKQIWELDPFWMRSAKPFNLARFRTLIRQLRGEKYDLTIELRGNPFNILLTSFIGSRYRVGYGAQGLGFLLTSAVPYEETLKHEIERNLDILRGLRLPISSQRPEFFVSEAAESRIQGFLRENGIQGEHLLVAMHPGASWPPKCWPIENYATLATVLIDRHRAKIILIGDTKETGLCIRLRDIMGPEERQHVVIAAGATTLQETAALIKSSKLFIGSDSGPLHIAHAVNTSAVALFGPQSPVMYGPHQNSAVAIYRKVDCSPCIQKVSQGCQRGLTCCDGLMSITPEEVLETIEGILLQRPESHNQGDKDCFFDCSKDGPPGKSHTPQAFPLLNQDR
jgi:heptosyltransferase II